MRFGFKTNPQDTTWADKLAVWRAADEIELFEQGWTFDHFYPIFSDSTGPCMEGWVTLTAARWAQYGNMAGGDLDTWRHKRDVLHAHCADIGRDPGEIATSVQIRLGPDGDPGPFVDQAAAFADAGVDIVVAYLPPPHSPAVLQKVASALEPLR